MLTSGDESVGIGVGAVGESQATRLRPDNA